MTAHLIGTGNEELTLDISESESSPSEPDFVMWDFSASLIMPDCFPSIQQSVRSTFFTLPSLTPLAGLIDGHSDKRFLIDEQNFRLEVYEHTLNGGPRFGFIVDINVRSSGIQYPDNWPSDVPDQILHDHRKGAVSQNFAFSVGQENLQSFHRDLTIDLRRVAKTVG